jgi:hypothetical protein
VAGLGGCANGFTTVFFGFFFSLPRASRLPILCSSLSSLMCAGSLRWPKPLRQFTVSGSGIQCFAARAVEQQIVVARASLFLSFASVSKLGRAINWPRVRNQSCCAQSN